MNKVFFLLLILAACDTPDRPIETEKISIKGRDLGLPIYQANIPLSWKRIDPESHQDLSDTTLPICSFESGDVLITIHNFPSQRVAPSAQIKRWKRQLQNTDVHVTPYAHGGFGGLKVEGEGMIAYAMQMTPVLFREVSNPQIKGDYTIKAIGPQNALENQKHEIDAFADSFELIDSIPSPL